MRLLSGCLEAWRADLEAKSQTPFIPVRCFHHLSFPHFKTRWA